jgi:phage-related protein
MMELESEESEESESGVWARVRGVRIVRRRARGVLRCIFVVGVEELVFLIDGRG